MPTRPDAVPLHMLAGGASKYFKVWQNSSRYSSRSLWVGSTTLDRKWISWRDQHDFQKITFAIRSSAAIVRYFLV